MRLFTLDSNCIIDLEEERSGSIYLKELKGFWQSGCVELAVVSASASENRPGGQVFQSYSLFEEKLRRVGLECVRELQPPGIWDLGYWDHMLWWDDEIERQVNTIRDILFPSIQTSPPSDPSAYRTWRGKMCDVLIVWAHGFHKADYLVTSDERLYKKSAELIEFGVRHVVTPREALEIAKRG
jgi:hypothetical protein